ncbi:putative transcription regulator [Marinomonas sp. MED121]|uniref:GntR family transcriptional regulator n=1 Tax=Marinomonas sp. MED121 TaxID=314277 RepID=UPI000069086A|nr:GntR family transcriptional regulator [Marinomonas sp. MED121]EAQ64593.1 putative transcription regulator [Marinomonas sp. MED121]
MSKEVLARIKADIKAQNLPVGEPLKQAELAKRYQVSRIPIRDSLQQLLAQGWLVPHGKCGVMIPYLLKNEAEDLYKMRSALEVMLLEYAIPNLNNAILGQAMDILERLDAKNVTLLERGELNWAFHKSLYDAAARPTLFKVVEQLHSQVDRYIGFQCVPLAYDDTSQSDHYLLLKLLQEKNYQAALSCLKQHIEKAGLELIQQLRE